MNCQMCKNQTDGQMQSDCGAYLCPECFSSCEEREGDCMACPVIE